MVYTQFRRKKFFMPLAITALVCFAVISDCRADSIAPPHSYEIIAGANDAFRFVMLANDPILNDEGTAYPVSGLYRNDGSTEPLWQIDWYAGRVMIANDGRYLVRMGSWASAPEDLAVAFYDRDQDLKSYKISDLIKNQDKLPQYVSHFDWHSDVSFDARRGILRIVTHDGQALYFLLSSGQLLDGPDP